MLKLGVNIDHNRNAPRGALSRSADLASRIPSSRADLRSRGAHGITAHLREDRGTPGPRRLGMREKNRKRG